MPVEIGRDDANICLYPSPHWTNQSAPASPHIVYPSATTFLAACHQAHYSLRSSLLCLGNRSGRWGKVAQTWPRFSLTSTKPLLLGPAGCAPASLHLSLPIQASASPTKLHTTQWWYYSFPSACYFQGVSLTAWGSEQPHSYTILLSARHLHHHVCFNETTRIFLIKSSFPCTPCHKQVQQLTQSYQPHLQRMETRSWHLKGILLSFANSH